MDLSYEFAYLLVTGEFDEAEFEAQTHLKRGWFYAAGTQQGSWFYPQNTMVVRMPTDDCDRDVSDHLESLLRVLARFSIADWPSTWTHCIHAVIYATGYQGGGFYWPVDLIGQLATNRCQVQVHHHQVPQYGHDNAGAVWQPIDAGEPRTPSAYAYFAINSTLYHADQISQQMGIVPSQAVSRHDRITTLPRPAHWQHHRQTCWTIQSRLSADQPLLAHLTDVLDQIEPCHQQIWQLHQELDVSMRLTATGHFPSHHVLSFDQALLKRLAVLHLSLDFDHYFLGDDP